MEDKNHKCGSCNSCGSCGEGHGCCGGHHHFHLLKWFLALVVFWMVFSLGVKVGEFRGEYMGDYSWHNRFYGDMPMMYGKVYSTTVSAPATPEVSPKPAK